MEKLLKAFGASNKESEVFLRLLELGSQPVSVVAKYVGIPRPSMYVILERLKKLQLIEEFQYYGIKYVKCISFKEMNDLLGSKERDFKQLLSLLSSKKEEFLALENKFASTNLVKLNKGKLEIMEMYEEILKNGEFCSIFNPGVVKKFMPEYFFKEEEVLKKNKCEVRELLVDCKEAHEYKKLFKSGFHRMKILPKSVTFNSDITVQKGVLYMISYDEPELNGTKIINKSLVKTHQVLFDYLWQTCDQ